MEKKYELVKENTKVLEDGTVLYQIRVLRDGIYPRVGDLGGYIESEENLSQEGRCWVDASSMVYGKAIVSEDASVDHGSIVRGTSDLNRPTKVSGNASLYNSIVFDGASVFGRTYLKDASIGKNGNVSTNSSWLQVGDCDTAYDTIDGCLVYTKGRVVSVEEYTKNSEVLRNILDVYFAGPEGIEFWDKSDFMLRVLRRQAKAFIPQSSINIERSTGFDAMIDGLSEAKRALLKDYIEQLKEYEE